MANTFVIRTQHQSEGSWGSGPVPGSVWTPRNWKWKQKHQTVVARPAYSSDMHERNLKTCQNNNRVPPHLSFDHTLTLSPQKRGHRRDSGKRSLVQTLEYVSCSSVHAGSATPRSGHSAKTPTVHTNPKRQTVNLKASVVKKAGKHQGLTWQTWKFNCIPILTVKLIKYILTITSYAIYEFTV